MLEKTIGKQINELYRQLERLKAIARNNNSNLRFCKEESKNFKPNPYKFYDYSPKMDYWDEESDLSFEQKMYAYKGFFKDALKATEKEIRKVKYQIKELQRKQTLSMGLQKKE